MFRRLSSQWVRRGIYKLRIWMYKILRWTEEHGYPLHGRDVVATADLRPLTVFGVRIRYIELHEDGI
jgi:hypothetical protein